MVLALVSGLLSLVGLEMAALPAQAQPVPCVQTFTGPGGAIAAPAVPDGANFAASEFTLATPAGSVVADVNITTDLVQSDREEIWTFLVHDSRQALLQPRSNPAGQVSPTPLTFDDEAPAKMATGSGSGSYQPWEPLTVMDGGPSGGAWTLRVMNWDAAVGQVRSWSITITYATCDSDGDGVEERSDNCASTPNAAQSDADRDGLGNECDPDIDGDGVANGDDNCVIVSNASQADMDHDGVGDRCDGDPDGDGVTHSDNCLMDPNSDQANSDADGLGDACDTDDDGDGVADAADPCRVVTGQAGGCPVAASRVRLRVVRGALAGRVTSRVSACRSARRVELFAARKGPDKRVAAKRSKRSGKFRIRLRRGQGTFYAVVRTTHPGGLVECRAAKSRKVRR